MRRFSSEWAVLFSPKFRISIFNLVCQCLSFLFPKKRAKIFPGRRIKNAISVGSEPKSHLGSSSKSGDLLMIPRGAWRQGELDEEEKGREDDAVSN